MIPRARPNYGFLDLAKAASKSRDSGPATEQIAEHLRRLLGLPYVLLTQSGRGALYLLLKSAPQSDVIVPSYTCSAVPEAAKLAGKTVIFAEHKCLRFNQTVEDVEPYLGSERIYIATHQYGLGAPISDLVGACHSAGTEVYEDIAAALGTRIDNRLAGTFGDACFGSFDTTKLLNAPLKGGFLATSNAEIYRRVELVARREQARMSRPRKAMLLVAALALVCLRNPKLYRVFHTINFDWMGRLTAESGQLESKLNYLYVNKLADWQANILLPQFARLDEIIERRRENYRTLSGIL